VTDQEQPYRTALNGQVRSLLAMLGVGLAVLLAVAAYLQPDRERHYGTHEQLGLPPCTFYLLFGVPCPTCGMTTAWAHLVRGEIFAACRANAGGALLGAMAIFAVPWSLVAALRGRWFAWTPRGNLPAWIGTGIVVVALAQWGCRLIGHFQRW
jgi:hypothetical protein